MIKRMNQTLTSILVALASIGTSAQAQYGSQGEYPAYSGDKRIAVILLAWKDRECPATRQDAADLLWNDDQSLRKYYLSMSRGALDFIPPAGDAPDGTVSADASAVYGPYELSIAEGFDKDITYQNCESYYGSLGSPNLSRVHPVARELASSRDGFNAEDYDYIMYVTPKGPSTGGVLGYAGIDDTYTHIYSFKPIVINHEMGHNLGLAHSNTSIDHDNYGSDDCIMGNSGNVHMDSVHTYNQGWYPDSVFSVQSYGQYEIENLAQPGTDNVKVLRFDRSAHAASTLGLYDFWVSYRVSGIGHDINLESKWDNKVNIHYCKAGSSRPYDDSSDRYYPNNNVSILSLGGDYTGPDNLCRIRFVRRNHNGNASAIVQFIDPDGNQPPSVLSGQEKFVAAGTNHFTLIASDPENDPLEYEVSIPPASGNLTVSNGTFTYTGHETGSFTCHIRVNDGEFDSYDELVTIHVVGQTAPYAEAGSDVVVAHSSNLPWDPSLTSTLAWFDAADSNSVIHTEGRVSQWLDKSGRNNHAFQPRSSSQPIYYSNNQLLQFNGKQFMAVSNDPFRDLQNFAAIGLQKWVSRAEGANTAMSYSGIDTGWSTNQWRRKKNKFTFNRIGTGSGDNISPDPNVLENFGTGGDFIGVGMRENSQDLSIRTNGGEALSLNNDSGSIDYQGRNRSCLGAKCSDDWNNPDFYLDGSLKELILINEADTEVVEMAEGYLAHKWSLADKLPDTHPYKTAPPFVSANLVQLNGSGSDEDGDQLSFEWSVVSGPGKVYFSNVYNHSTRAAASEFGRYVLRLSVSDGLQTSTDDVIVDFLRNDGPEIHVTGLESHAINDGDSTSSSIDGTDFGIIAPGSEKTSRFTIGNYGSSNLVLTGTPKVSITGSSSFTLINQPNSPVVTSVDSPPVIGTTDFEIRFSPTNDEMQSAMVTIASNDGDEPEYSFVITGNRPVVDVISTDPEADEGGMQTGTWTFTRSGSSTSQALNIQFRMSGTASAGDYSLSSMGEVTIPSGENSVILSLIPVTDLEVEGVETATLTIIDTGEYTIANGQSSIQINEPDQILVNSPNGGETLIVDTTTVTRWSSLADGSVNIELFKGGLFHSTIVSSTPNDGRHEWHLADHLVRGQDYQIKISLISDGGVADISDGYFSIIRDPLGEALDAHELEWTTGGDGGATWFSQTAVTWDGLDALQSGSLADSGSMDDYASTWIQTSLNGPGVLTFRWKVSSEQDYDYLRFFFNDVEQGSQLKKISGNINWVEKTAIIPPGSHIVRWAYTKDHTYSENNDSAWLDQVSFTPADYTGHVVSFDKQGGTGGSNTVTAFYEEPMPSASAPTKSGFQFLGYFSEPRGRGEMYYDGDMQSTRSFLSLDSEITIYAHWVSSYSTWSDSAPFDGDANSDGITNGLAWLLGAPSPDAAVPEDHLPRIETHSFNRSRPRFIFYCLRSEFRSGGSLKIQFSSDMGNSDPWHQREMEVPALPMEPGTTRWYETISRFGFTITASAHDTETYSRWGFKPEEIMGIIVTVPIADNEKIFMRLHASP